MDARLNQTHSRIIKFVIDQLSEIYNYIHFLLVSLFSLQDYSGGNAAIEFGTTRIMTDWVKHKWCKMSNR